MKWWGNSQPSSNPSAKSIPTPVRTSEVTVLIIHGRGVPGPKENWPHLIRQAMLVESGYGGAGTVKVVAPSYADVTGFADVGYGFRGAFNVPGQVAEPLGTESATFLQHDLVGLWSDGDLRRKPSKVNEQLLHGAGKLWDSDFRDYMTEPGMRDKIRSSVTEFMSDVERLVLVGHSMGSLVALDVLSALSTDIEVLGLITLGSPLPNRHFHSRLGDQHFNRAAARAPIWINLADPKDFVTGGAAISTSWPKARSAIDIAVDNSKVAKEKKVKNKTPEKESRHSAARYMRQPAFGLALSHIVSALPQPTPFAGVGWSLIADIDQHRNDIKGSGDKAVNLRSFLQKVVDFSHQRGPTNENARSLYDTQYDLLRLDPILIGLCHLCCALWGLHGTDRDDVAYLLKTMTGTMPFGSRADLIVQTTAEVAKKNKIERGTSGLSPSSNLWDWEIVDWATPQVPPTPHLPRYEEDAQFIRHRDLVVARVQKAVLHQSLADQVQHAASVVRSSGAASTLASGIDRFTSRKISL